MKIGMNTKLLFYVKSNSEQYLQVSVATLTAKHTRAHTLEAKLLQAWVKWMYRIAHASGAPAHYCYRLKALDVADAYKGTMGVYS